MASNLGRYAMGVIAIEDTATDTNEGGPYRDRLLAMTVAEILGEANSLGVPPSTLMRWLD